MLNITLYKTEMY